MDRSYSGRSSGLHLRRFTILSLRTRTLREALAAERLEEKLGAKGGEAALFAEAKRIAEKDDLSRWAEPYALLSGRVKDPDGLVRALVRENRALGLRALASGGIRPAAARLWNPNGVR